MKICVEISDSGEVRVACEGNDKLCDALRLALNAVFTTLALIDATVKSLESKTTSTGESQ